MPLPAQPRAVVTGGGGGLGRAFCLQLAARGGRILVADIDLAGAQETVELVARAGGKAHAVKADVAKLDEVEQLGALADEHVGGCDLIVNNAGVAVAGPVGDIPIRDWEWIMGINLWGVIYGCHAFIPRFKKQGSGAILNVASAAGLLASAEMGPYNVTKAGVVALSETLASELAAAGIGVSVLCPTFFKTNIGKSGRTTRDMAGQVQLIDKLMARAKLQADDVARIALEHVDRKALYVVPHPDGQWAWRLKRLAPERFYKTLMPKVMARMRKS